MINKFPKLNKKQKEKMEEWLDTQVKVMESDALKYEACGNEEEAIKHNAYASSFAQIKIYIDYHMEK